MADYILWLIPLANAYILGYSVMQLDWFAKRKHKKIVKSIDVVIHGCLAYIFCAQWSIWYVPVFMVVIHQIMRLINIKLNDRWSGFLFYHTLYLSFIFLTSLTISYLLSIKVGGDFKQEYIKILTVLSCFLVTVNTSGELIGKIVGPIASQNNLILSGLKDGGKKIGQLERALIFMFILFNIPSGIGFLIAAKSILRFSEAKDDRKFAEYVLIGTFWSYGIAILIGMFNKYIIGLLS